MTNHPNRKKQGNTAIITRDGKKITLTIDKYEGQMVLAYGDDGRPYIKRKGGRWTQAHFTV